MKCEKNGHKALKLSIISLFMILVAVLAVTTGVSTVSAFAGQTQSCDTSSGGCHAYPAGTLRLSVTSPTTLTVAPGASFTVNLSWTGGNSTANNEVNWPTSFLMGVTRDNTAFNPSPRVPYTGSSSSGTTSSTLVAPTTPGPYTVRVYASTKSPTQTDYKDIAITVAAPPTPPTISTASLPAGTVGTTYSQSLDSTGGTIPYSWSVSAGALPAGLTLSSTGVISGAPTTTGTYNFTVAVTDAAAAKATTALSILVNPAAINIATASLPAATVGAAYSQTLAATGGTTPYAWSVSVGALPAGLNLSSGGLISGMPTTAGTFSFTVKVTGGTSASQALSIDVNAAGIPLSVTTTSLAAGTTGKAYSQSLAATGGTTPYTWSVSVGALPAGLNLSSGGLISGTPTTVITSNFTVTVTGGSATATKELSIAVAAPADTAGPLTSLMAVSPDPTLGATSATLTATISDTTTGGSKISAAEYFVDTVEVNGTGNPMTASDGIFNSVSESVTAAVNTSGLSAGNHSLYVHGLDTANIWGPSMSVAFTVSAAFGPLSITTSSLPVATLGTAYSQTLAASGGTPPYAWSISSGSLPAGLSLSASAGAITGTPTAAGPAGAVSAAASGFTVQVKDAAAGTAAQTLSITVNAASADTSGPLASNVTVSLNGIEGVASVTVRATISDAATGGSKIAAAEYFIDASGAAGTGSSMRASDGSFSSMTELVKAILNVSALSSGKHAVYVRGQDAAGNWGKTSSSTFSVGTSYRHQDDEATDESDHKRSDDEVRTSSDSRHEESGRSGHEISASTSEKASTPSASTVPPQSGVPAVAPSSAVNRTPLAPVNRSNFDGRKTVPPTAAQAVVAPVVSGPSRASTSDAKSLTVKQSPNTQTSVKARAPVGNFSKDKGSPLENIKR